MKTKSWTVLLAVLGLGFAAAQQAFVYTGFAEIHEPIRLPAASWTWFPDAELSGSLVDGTVRLLGVEETRRVWRGGAVIFFYEGAGAAQLAYLTRNLGYSLYYDLDADRGRFVGWSKIENRLGRPLAFERLTFVAGEVPLRSGGAPVMSKSARGLALDAVAEAAPMPSYAGSGGGVYRYVLENPPTLEVGVNELPFLKADLDPVYTWRYQGSFAPVERIAFTRGYTFTAPAALAGGMVNVRADGVLLGQAYMQDAAKGSRVQVWLGADPEGRAERRIDVLKDERKEKAYRVRTTLRNPRSRPVRVELVEGFSARELVLKLPPGAERTPQGYRYVVTLKPGEAREFVYTVTLRY
ncbi:hypothetical protein Ocepr_0741 [Oceanithermus profundus DSM 14977]|uniref:DUF4139 domain-containing protein n=1 Tax=Oceanithermus profundus (strain DSM 14977 / NBRC 100410 / VKM B-2274 / 506) TaxID=670487 RepID=E4U4B3_OCEP5|nr:hypothetical protein [Oceanithermus profundus]ADR36198.1 hypothetical protein Ocepr_0741 [Oceanithermus profundus DSM 14977]